MSTVENAKTEIVQRNTNNTRLNDTRYFHQRALLQSLNLSVGILITAIMIFKLKNSNKKIN